MQNKAECDNIETVSYNSQIDTAALVIMDMASTSIETLDKWFAISTLGEDKVTFVGRVNGEFDDAVEAGLTTEPSDITVVEYPDDCDEYSMTIMESM